MPERPPSIPPSREQEPTTDSIRKERYAGWTQAREAHEAALRAAYKWLEDPNRDSAALDRLFADVDRASQEETRAMHAYFETLVRE